MGINMKDFFVVFGLIVMSFLVFLSTVFTVEKFYDLYRGKVQFEWFIYVGLFLVTALLWSLLLCYGFKITSRD